LLALVAEELLEAAGSDDEIVLILLNVGAP
jgi:hypothetical protein